MTSGGNSTKMSRNMILRSKGTRPFLEEVQDTPNWHFCRKHVKDSMFYRYVYARITMRHIPTLLQSGKCEAVINNKKCKDVARYSVLYESDEMIERNRRLHR